MFLSSAAFTPCYKEIVHEKIQYDTPKIIIGRLKKLGPEIANGVTELEAMLEMLEQ